MKRKAFLGVLLWSFMGFAAAPSLAVGSSNHAVCRAGTARVAGCYAKVLTGQNGTFVTRSVPAGYGPVAFHRAYGVPLGGNATVAVVGAYGDPAAKADLDIYDKAFGLGVFPVCTRAAQTACFNQLNQRGTATLPRTDAGWATETALDTQTVHEICPGCRLDLIEADTASTANLMTAIDQAVTRGATVVSMSWGGGESVSEVANDAHFNHPGVIFVASSGDSGYGVSYPAASANVLAVGGTSLNLVGNVASETAWADGGSGCSKYETKPAWQHDSGCARRTVADVAADADPNTGAAVYSSLTDQGTAGWMVVGGTSLAAPLVAGIVAVSGKHSQAAVLAQLYQSVSANTLRDVTFGKNGSCHTYLCRARAGYDGPTGVGSLIGLGSL